MNRSIDLIPDTPMQEGLAGQIAFLGPDCIHRHAALTPTDITLGGLHTVESLWLLWEGLTPASEAERIRYFAHDRSIWWARVHCRWRHERHLRKIDVWFEHERDNGGGIHFGEDLNFLDWQGNRWTATVQTVHEPFPAAPKFILRRV